MKSMSKLSPPLQIRLRETDNGELRELSAETSIPFAVLVRLSVQHGLAELKKSLRMPSQPSSTPSSSGAVASTGPTVCPCIVEGKDPDLNLR